MPRRRKPDPNTWTVVRLPERDLAGSILELAAPLLEPLGPTPPPDDAHRALELAIDLWNAQVQASELWGDPNPKPLRELRNKMCGKAAPPGLAETFALMAARWRDAFVFDPRLVGNWSFRAIDDGPHALVCETVLAEGVKVEVPPPAELRVAIGGKFLDEVRTRLTDSSFLSFPVKRHRGELSSDGGVTIYTKLPTAIALFAEGLLPPAGGAPVDVMVAGQKLGPMVLGEVRCTGYGGFNDAVVLVFRTVSEKKSCA